jgi:hypothetical protein
MRDLSRNLRDRNDKKEGFSALSNMRDNSRNRGLKKNLSYPTIAGIFQHSPIRRMGYTTTIIFRTTINFNLKILPLN